MNAAIVYGIGHQGQAVSYVHRRGVAYDDAEDVVQEALLACWRQGETGIEFPSSYWYRVLMSKIINYRRCVKREPDRLPDDPPLESRHPEAQQIIEGRERLAEVLRQIPTTPRRRVALAKLMSDQPLSVKERVVLYHLRSQLKRSLHNNG